MPWKPWDKLIYHEEQARLWSYNGSIAVVLAGRGSGKTELAKRKIVRHLSYKKPWNDPKYAYLLPTYQQAKRVAWDDMLDRLIPPHWIKKNGINRTENTIKTIFGSILFIIGMDKPYRFEGFQLDGVVVDESSDQKLGMFNKTLVPMLSHRNPFVWRIGVPKKGGIGKKDFKAAWEEGKKKKNREICSFHWKAADILGKTNPDRLELAKSILTPDEFREQYMAEWLDEGGSIYYAFSSENLDESARYDPTQVICVGCDFNVDPMCWTLMHFYGDKLVVFDEIFLGNTNTPKTLDFLHDKYSYHEAGWRFFGDASGKARKSSANKTDYIWIKNDTRFLKKKVNFPDRNPAPKDRFSTVNAAFLNAKGERRVFINPKCKHLINDFEVMAYIEKTSDPEDYSGTEIGHMADGFGYTVMRLMPQRLAGISSGAVITTIK